MKHPSRPVRGGRDVRSSFHHQLDCYALQAAAAGVGVLALTQPAEARIIYTPTHHVIDNGGSYQLDFNHDGATDLSFRNWATLACTTDGSCWPRQDLAASLATGNRAVHNIYGAMALKPGMLIGSKQVFRGKQEMMAIAGTGSTSQAWGSWVNVKNRYLGVRFKIKGQAHYGWARLNVQVQLPLTISATLTGYAYETVPNKAIIAGKTKGADVVTIDEPTSLGRLAQGSAGLASWRPGK